MWPSTCFNVYTNYNSSCNTEMKVHAAPKLLSDWKRVGVWKEYQYKVADNNLGCNYFNYYERRFHFLENNPLLLTQFAISAKQPFHYWEGKEINSLANHRICLIGVSKWTPPCCVLSMRRKWWGFADEFDRKIKRKNSLWWRNCFIHWGCVYKTWNKKPTVLIWYRLESELFHIHT